MTIICNKNYQIQLVLLAKEFLDLFDKFIP